MNSTTGAEATAWSIAVLTSCDNNLVCIKDCEIRGRSVDTVDDGCSAATAPRRACALDEL